MRSPWRRCSTRCASLTWSSPSAPPCSSAASKIQSDGGRTRGRGAYDPRQRRSHTRALPGARLVDNLLAHQVAGQLWPCCRVLALLFRSPYVSCCDEIIVLNILGALHLPAFFIQDRPHQCEPQTRRAHRTADPVWPVAGAQHLRQRAGGARLRLLDAIDLHVVDGTWGTIKSSCTVIRDFAMLPLLPCLPKGAA